MDYYETQWLVMINGRSILLIDGSWLQKRPCITYIICRTDYRRTARAAPVVFPVTSAACQSEPVRFSHSKGRKGIESFGEPQTPVVYDSRTWLAHPILDERTDHIPIQFRACLAQQLSLPSLLGEELVRDTKRQNIGLPIGWPPQVVV